jgi:glycosyltransferase involved in cell wall biosynthesis
MEYEQAAAILSIAERITFHGMKSKQEVAEFMRQADLFVLPSLFETFSIVTAEALSTGIPVLATRCGGPEEFVNEDVGLVVPPGDEEALCKGLDYMMDNLEKFNPNKISSYAR